MRTSEGRLTHWITEVPEHYRPSAGDHILFFQVTTSDAMSTGSHSPEQGTENESEPRLRSLLFKFYSA